MGEMAEYMLNGDDCEWCGEYLGDGLGYPRLCSSCQREADRMAPAREAATRALIASKCPHCGKRLKSPQGVSDHVRMVHEQPSPTPPPA